MGKTVDERIRNLYFIDQTAAGNPTEEGEARLVSNDLVTYVDGFVQSLVKVPATNTVHVSKGGNDTSGAVGRIDRPYLTIGAAIAASTSGDVILVYPGTYAEKIVCKAGVCVLGLDRLKCIISYNATSGTESTVTMATDMRLANLTIAASANTTINNNALLWLTTSHDTSVAEDITIAGSGAGDVNGADFSGVTPTVVDDNHFCMQRIDATLVSEVSAIGVVGAGLATTNRIHMRNCRFEVEGTGGIGCSVVGHISAPGCIFSGAASDVSCLSPIASNVYAYDSISTIVDMGGGGLSRLGGYDHSITGGTLYADGIIGNDDTAIAYDASRPSATIQDALDNAGTGDCVKVAPGTYAEALSIPAGVRLDAPGCSVLSIVMATGSSVLIGEITPGASVAGIAASGGTIQVDVGAIVLSGNTALGVVSSLTANINGSIRCIVETGTPSTTVGIIMTGTGVSDLHVGELNADTAYDIGIGCTLNMFVHQVTGIETGSGTANVTKAGSAGGLSAVAIENTAIVTKAGNDGTGAVGDWGRPYLTIVAAIAACAAGDTIIVYPGTYSEIVSLKAGVSLLGTDKANCIINHSSVGSTNVINSASDCVFANFTITITANGGHTVSGIKLASGTGNDTFCAKDIDILGSGAGILHCCNGLTGTSDSPDGHFVFERIRGISVGSGYGLQVNSAAGIFRARDCHFTGGIYGALLAGETELRGGHYGGATQGLFIIGAPAVVTHDNSVSYSSLSVISSGTYTLIPGMEVEVIRNDTVYVTKSGDDSTGERNNANKSFLTITAAIAASISGDLILVYPGTYTEKFTLASSTTLRGTDMDRCIIVHSSTVTGEFVIGSGNASTIENFTVILTANNGHSVYGFKVGGTHSASWLARNIIFIGVSPGTGNASGVDLLTASGTPIATHYSWQNCEFRIAGTTTYGFISGASGVLRAENCHVSGGAYGLLISCDAFIKGGSYDGSTFGILNSSNDIKHDGAVSFNSLSIGGTFELMEGAGIAGDLESATTIIDVRSATAPTTDQVLRATGAAAATWQPLPNTLITDQGGDAEVADVTLRWATDNTADIGDVADLRPRDANVARNVTAGSAQRIVDAVNGGIFQFKFATELVTIAASPFSDSSITIPAGTICYGVASLETVAGGGYTTYDIGIAGDTQRFAANISAAADVGTASPPSVGYTGDAVRITPDGTPSDALGRVRIQIWYVEIFAPSS